MFIVDDFDVFSVGDFLRSYTWNEMASYVVNIEYISVGCNKNPYSLDWGFNGLVAFAAANSIALYLPQVCK